MTVPFDKLGGWDGALDPDKVEAAFMLVAQRVLELQARVERLEEELRALTSAAADDS